MKTLVISVFACLILMTAGGVYATNIPVLNPSFELGDGADPLNPGGTAPLDWHLSYYSQSNTGSAADPDAPDGDYVAVFSGWWNDAYIWQTVSAAFEANTIYTLSAYARAAPNQQSWGAIKLDKPRGANEAVPDAWIDGPTTFTQWTTTVNTAENPSLVGEAITIVLFQKHVDGERWTHFMNYDMVSLSSTPVPEPSSLLALQAGVMGLVGFMLRRRR